MTQTDTDEIEDIEVIEDIAGADDAASGDAAFGTLRSGKSGAAWGAVLPLCLLAGIGGAAGGWALTRYFPPPMNPAMAVEQSQSVDLAPITQRLERAEKTLSGHKAQLSRLTAELSAGATTITSGISSGVSPSGINSESKTDLKPLIARLERLEAAAKDISTSSQPHETEAETSSVDNGQTSTGQTSTGQTSTGQTSTGQTSPVETSVAAIDFAPDIEALKGRVAALETELEQTRALAAAPTIIKDTVLLPSFPRAAILEAMTSGSAAAPQGWLDKTLKKHISVRDPKDVARVNAVLDAIEKNIDAGDHALALEGVEALPSQARSAAKTWIEAVRREVKG